MRTGFWHYMSNLSDIGFPTPDEQAVNEMIMHVLEVARPVKCPPRGLYLRYSDPSGAEIYLQGNTSGELIGFNPHYAGKSRRQVGLERVIERDSSELDGGFYAWADPDPEQVIESGEYPFVFDVPDFRLNDRLRLPALREIQLTAFASNDFQIFESEETFYNAQEEEVKLAAQCFIPSGLFNLGENQPEKEETPPPPPMPFGMFAGEIKGFELKTNELSGKPFYWFLIETLGGAADVVADPKLVSAEPPVGGIVSGQFWLSGRLL